MNVASTTRPLHAIILAAGKGTRMQSDLPKVLHPVAGRAMVHWVIDACVAVGVERCVVIVGHQSERVRAELAERENIEFVEQTEQLGTGHAVMQAGPAFENVTGDTFVLCGDGPLIRPATLQKVLVTHRHAEAAATLATALLDDPEGYGRIVRDEDGGFKKIVEHKDATADELEINEVNPSYYCFDIAALFGNIDKLGNDNAKGEYYITDIFQILREAGRTIEVIDAVPAEDIYSINTPQQLAEVDAILRSRLAGDEAAGSDAAPTSPSSSEEVAR